MRELREIEINAISGGSPARDFCYLLKSHDIAPIVVMFPLMILGGVAGCYIMGVGLTNAAFGAGLGGAILFGIPMGLIFEAECKTVKFP